MEEFHANERCSKSTKAELKPEYEVFDELLELTEAKRCTLAEPDAKGDEKDD